MTRKIVFYPGSFDPVTFGHLDMIARAAQLFDEVVIGIGVHHAKKTLFSPEERRRLLEAAIAELPCAGSLSLTSFDNLAVDAARKSGAVAILRGLRDTTDFAYEMQMAGMNNAVAPGLDTIFLPSAGQHRHIAATFVRQMAQMGGEISAFAPPAVAKLIKDILTARPPS
ncbi:MAG: pantetheine-phosphate adenylyltransferase [Hyphomicrobiales bacterium]|nr:pantetheine-phosphate adenylyltransferase [Hyphomicrobiales bacterium]